MSRGFRGRRRPVVKLVDDRSQLGILIKSATSTGETSLDAAKLKEIKEIVKKSDDNVSAAFSFCLARLKEKHSQASKPC